MPSVLTLELLAYVPQLLEIDGALQGLLLAFVEIGQLLPELLQQLGEGLDCCLLAGSQQPGQLLLELGGEDGGEPFA